MVKYETQFALGQELYEIRYVKAQGAMIVGHPLRIAEIVLRHNAIGPRVAVTYLAWDGASYRAITVHDVFASREAAQAECDRLNQEVKPCG